MIISIRKTIMLLLLIAASIPVGYIFFIPVGPVLLNPYEVIYLLVITLCIVRIIKSKLKININVFFSISFLFIFFIYAFYSILENQLLSVIQQLRFYLPFFVALFIILAKVSYNTEELLIKVSYAVLISSLIIIMDRFYGFIKKPDTFVVAGISDADRLPWDGAMLCFFPLVIFSCFKLNRYFDKFVILFSVFSSLIAVFFTFNRTIMFGILGFFLLGFIFNYKNKKISSWFIKLFGIAIFFSSIYLILTIDDSAWKLFEYRYLGGKEGFYGVYKESFEVGRYEMYEQFWDSIKNNFPFGQGFGLPFYVDRYHGLHDTATTDISLLAFILPFGVIGFIIFISFLFILWRNINLVTVGSFYGVSFDYYFFILKSLFFISILISLNLDIYSRNIFVVFFCFISNIFIFFGKINIC